MNRIQIENSIRDLVKQYFSQQKKEPFVPGKTKIPLNIPSFDWEEACEAIDSILSTYVTMGRKVKEFEAKFADYIGVKHAIMVDTDMEAIGLKPLGEGRAILTNRGLNSADRALLSSTFRSE